MARIAGTGIPRGLHHQGILQAFAWAVSVWLVLLFPMTLDFDQPAVADPVLYATGAKALAEGHGYRMVTHLHEPKITHYPPLQSAYLSVFWHLGADTKNPSRSLHAGMVLLQAACAWLMYLWLQHRGMPRFWAWLMVLTVATSHAWLMLGAFFFSEPLFLLVALLILMMWEREWIQAGNAARWWLTGSGLALMFLIRPAALGLIAGTGLLAFILFFRNNRTPLMAVCVPVLLAMLAWRWWCADLPGHAEETSMQWQRLGWSGTLKAVTSNALGYAGGHSLLELLSIVSIRLAGVPLVQRLGMAEAVSVFRWIAALVLCWLTIRGALAELKPSHKALRLVALVYLVQIIVYPWHMGPRALVVLLPLLLVWAWHGMARWIPPSFSMAPGRTLLLAAVVCINIAANCYLARADARGFRASMQGEWEAMDHWLAGHVGQDKVVAASSTLPIYRFRESSGRKFAEDDFPPAMDFVVVMPGKAERPRADYLLVSVHRWNALQSYGDESTARFSIAHQSPKGQFLVLRVERDLPHHEQPAPAKRADR